MNYLSYFKNENEIRECISKNVMKVRNENKLTQEDLAELMDVSIEHISRIENCRYTCSISFIFRFCTLFKMDVNEFFHIKPGMRNSLVTYLDKLPVDEYKTVVKFCEEVKKYYRSK